MLHPLTCHIPPLMHTEMPVHSSELGDDHGEPGHGEVTKWTLWVRLRKLVHKDKRKDLTLLERARLCLGEPGEPPPQPRGQAGELQGWGSGALPHTHGQGPPEVQVQEVLHLVGDLKPKPLADHHMPGGAELLVHCLLDHLCSTLEGRGCRSGIVTGTCQLLHQMGKRGTELLAETGCCPGLMSVCLQDHRRVYTGPSCRGTAPRHLSGR